VGFDAPHLLGITVVVGEGLIHFREVHVHTSVTLGGITPSYDASRSRSPISSETQANGVPIDDVDIDELWDRFTIAREHRRNYLMSM
jgi:hypothetical protein